MLDKITSRISSANLLALIALFVVLGGGYALAFSGSGTLQKAGETGITSVGPGENIRTLNGYGTLRARCETDTDEINYSLDNTTSVQINGHATNELDGSFGDLDVDPGHQTFFESNGIQGSIRIHLFKEGATTKSGVEIVVSNAGPFSNDCTTADVRVMALNTIE
jgi:hypothetical protein